MNTIAIFLKKICTFIPWIIYSRMRFKQVISSSKFKHLWRHNAIRHVGFKVEWRTSLAGKGSCRVCNDLLFLIKSLVLASQLGWLAWDLRVMSSSPVGWWIQHNDLFGSWLSLLIVLIVLILRSSLSLVDDILLPNCLSDLLHKEWPT